ncbi:acetyl-CoA acetyltransferase [Aestuariispira insulae]|uniref:Acetyl-CoA C-acetyltransferase n=1 Tax=Aestuariispira insulae TaxID=1461337 RepID=A0A3D9HRX9_9PROT|nr:acetyl-CoA acetyltransferase [Aestuariispira insulae]RED52258.1 acetyl-CoA C-acetyltransferase [Aestuariispira insulae]
MTACMVGWAHSKFGKLEEEDVESLVIRVARDAIKDAGVSPEEIDAIYLGWYNGGFSKQDFGSSLVINGIEGLRFKPSTRVENACATGSAAMHQGANFIEAKQGRCVLVVGVEKMTATPGPEIGGILLQASYLKEEGETEGGFAGVFGQIAGGYFQKYGDKSDALARIAAKNHKNGCDNPYAQMQKDLGFEFCRDISEKNPIVAGPLKRTDCSLVSDGAAAAVLTDVETALAHEKAVVIRGRAHLNDFLPMSRRDMTFLDGCAKAWEKAHAMAGTTVDDLSFVETHDCFTIAELMQYEAMGLTEKGAGEKAIAEGWTERDGKLPVNPSGGLKSKGHPIGATGVSMHVLSAMQLRGEAGGIQVKDAKLGGVYNMGGAGVANYCTILEALR